MAVEPVLVAAPGALVDAVGLEHVGEQLLEPALVGLVEDVLLIVNAIQPPSSTKPQAVSKTSGGTSPKPRAATDVIAPKRVRSRSRRTSPGGLSRSHT